MNSKQSAGPVKKTSLFLAKWLCLLIALLIILFAVLVTIVRLADPYLNAHKHDIEHMLSKQLGQPVSIGKIDMWWQGLGPMVKFEQVRVGHNIQTQEIHADVNLPSSLWHRRLMLSGFKVKGGIYRVKRTESGSVIINGEQFRSDPSPNRRSGLHWLLSEGNISITNASIQYVTEHDKTIAGHIDYLTLSNNDSLHQLSGQFTLKKPVNIPVKFNLAASGPGTNLAKMHIRLYLNTGHLKLADILGNQAWHGERITQGEVSGKLWLNWLHGHVDKVQSQLQLTQVVVRSIKQWLQVPALSANLAWVRQNQGWRFIADRVHITVNHHIWPVEQVLVDHQTVPQHLSIAIKSVSLNELRMLLNHTTLLSPQNLKKLDTLHPEGTLKQVVFEHTGDDWQPRSLGFSAHLQQFGMHQLGGIPRVTGLTGAIYWLHTKGNLVLDSKDFQFGDSSVFKAPLKFTHLVASLRLLWPDKGDMTFDIDRLFMANSEFIGQLLGAAKINPKMPSEPYLSLMMNFQFNKMQHIGHYLPVKIMYMDTVNWLEQGFLSGRMNSSMLFRGRGDLFPFNTSMDTFEVDSSVHDLRLSFSPYWPIMSIPFGEDDFINDQMDAHVPNGKFGKVSIQNVSGQIPVLDADEPQLYIKGAISDTLQNALHVIMHSPLHDTIGQNIAEANPKGGLNLHLQLDIPFNHSDDTRVFGQLGMHNVSGGVLGVPNAIKDVNGLITFTNNSLSSNTITSILFGEPATTRFVTNYDDKNDAYVYTLTQSAFNTAYFQKIFGIPLTHFAKGVAPYKIFIARPLNLKAQDSGITVQAQSDLKGVAISAPQNLSKAANLARLLQLKLVYYNQQFTTVNFNYGNLLGMDIDVMHQPGAQGKPAPIGLSINASLKSFVLADWQAFFKRKAWLLKSTKHASDTFTNWKSQLVGVNLQAEYAKAYGQVLKNLSLNLIPKPDIWSLEINSNNIAGLIIWPQRQDIESFVARFRKLHLMPVPPVKTSIKLNPETLPRLSLNIKDFLYDNKYHIQNVIYQSQPIKHGVLIQHFQTTGPLLTTNLQATWVQNHHRNLTHVIGKVSSQNIQKMLKNFNFKKDLDLTTGSADVDLTWHAPLYQPNLKTLLGKATVSLGPGDIGGLDKSTMSKLDFGKLLNALSISSILDRLTLSQVNNQSGYNFTSMNGDLEIKHSILHTNKIIFLGPVASIVLHGDVDFAKRRYNLNLEVTPHVTGSVPVIAGLLVNPLVGVVSWFANTVISPAVGQIATKHFQMTGSWDKPIIKSLDKMKKSKRL